MKPKKLVYELLDDLVCLLVVWAGFNFSAPFLPLIFEINKVPVSKVLFLLFPLFVFLTFILLALTSQIIGRKFDKVFENQLSHN